MKIYADHAATTKLDIDAFKAMKPFLLEEYANPSQMYSFARGVRRALQEARETIADCINALPNEIYFTSGGTEANNWAIIGLAMANRGKGNHIITSKIEHHSVLDACAYLERNGFKVTYLDVDKYGFINFADYLGALTQDTILVSIMSANNEIGTIQNIKAIAQTAKEKGVIFHTDAVQLYGHMNIDCEDIGIDALSISAHKIHGPKGIGALYVSDKINIEPYVMGGNQERGKRGGTVNVAEIAGFAKASEIAYRDLVVNNYKTKTLAEYFVTQLEKEVPDISINGYARQKLPNIVSVSFAGIDGSALLMMLDLKGVYISTGSACMANALDTSHVVRAIGLNEDMAKGTVRFSFSKNNEPEEIDRAIAIIKESVLKLRALSPTYTKTKKSTGTGKRGRPRKIQ